MSRMLRASVLLAGLMLATSSFADAPAGAPGGATGLCKDGSYWTNATKKGACHGHKGVKDWYGAADAATSAAPAAPAAAAPMAASAAAPGPAPAGATGLCKDGTYWTNATKKGACHGHKGVKDWYGAAAATSTAAATPPPAAPPAPMPAPAAASKPAAAATHENYTPPASAAPGGGPGMVWVNKNSKVYHCPADRWYGKTKNGAYMSEADAKAQGNRPDHGKACS